MKAERVAALHYLSKDYGAHPHEYLGSETWGTGMKALYWKWAVDSAARTCAMYLEEQDRLKAQLPKGYMQVERE